MCSSTLTFLYIQSPLHIYSVVQRIFDVQVPVLIRGPPSRVLVVDVFTELGSVPAGQFLSVGEQDDTQDDEQQDATDCQAEHFVRYSGGADQAGGGRGLGSCLYLFTQA